MLNNLDSEQMTMGQFLCKILREKHKSMTANHTMPETITFGLHSVTDIAGPVSISLNIWPQKLLLWAQWHTIMQLYGTRRPLMAAIESSWWDFLAVNDTNFLSRSVSKISQSIGQIFTVNGRGGLPLFSALARGEPYIQDSEIWPQQTRKNFLWYDAKNIYISISWTV